MVGNGAREHSLVWKLSQSPKVSRLFAAPGNAGTGRIAANLEIKVNDFSAILQKVKQERIELIVVGPEVPLAEGIVDFFRARDIAERESGTQNSSRRMRPAGGDQ